MKNKALKSALKFWQEIVLIIPIVLLFIEITKWVIRSQTVDGWDIFMIIWLLPLFICLVGQFFWKSETVAEVLSVFLGLSSAAVIFMGLYGVFSRSLTSF